LEDLTVVLVAGRVQHEARARVVQIVPGVGVALECDAPDELKAALEGALAVWAGDSGTSFSQWGRPSSTTGADAVTAEVQVDEDFDARPTIRPVAGPDASDSQQVDSDPPTLPQLETTADANLPLADRIKAMSTAEKRQLALNGDKAARTLLLNDPNKTIHVFIIRNNSITTDEVRYIAGFRQTNPDVLKQISENREWMKNPLIVAALVANPKTPSTVATKLVSKLPIQEIRRLAKSQAVPRAVSAVAKKLVIGE
jgi:hypothetical protein